VIRSQAVKILPELVHKLEVTICEKPPLWQVFLVIQLL